MKMQLDSNGVWNFILIPNLQRGEAITKLEDYMNKNSVQKLTSNSTGANSVTI